MTRETGQSRDGRWKAKDWVTAITAVIGAAGALGALALGIINHAQQNKRRLAIEPKLELGERCLVGDALTVEVNNTGFQAASITEILFREGDGELTRFVQARFLRKRGSKSVTVRQIPGDQGLPRRLEAAETARFTYSLGDVIRSNPVAVVVEDQDGKRHSAGIRSVLSRVPSDGRDCPQGLPSG